MIRWQIDRGQLNHSWLQNGVLVALNHAIGIIIGEVRPQKVRKTLAEDIFRWRDRRQDLFSLLNRFEHEMSPKVFFDQLPLSRCSTGTKCWLVPLTHELWLRRERVKEKIDTAIKAYDTTEELYETVMASLDTLSEAPAVDELLPFQLLLRNFTTACEALSRSISALPQEVRCV